MKQIYIGVDISLQGRARSLQESHVDIPAHDHQAFGQGGKLRIKPGGHGDVCESTSAVDHDLSRVLSDLFDHPRSRVVSCQCPIGVSLQESGFDHSLGITRRRVITLGLKSGIFDGKGALLEAESAHTKFHYHYRQRIMTYPSQVTMQVFPCLEQLWRIHQRVVGALVHRDTREISNLECREPMQTGLQSPGVGSIADQPQNIPPSVEGHQVWDESGGTPIIVQDDLRGRRRRVSPSDEVFPRLSSVLEVAGCREGSGRHGDDDAGDSLHPLGKFVGEDSERSQDPQSIAVGDD